MEPLYRSDGGSIPPSGSKCVGCGELFTANRPRQYCNRSCGAKHMRSTGKVPGRPRRQTNPCATCGLPVKEVHRTYCSSLCATEGRKSRLIQDWYAGLYNATATDGTVQEAIRVHLIHQAHQMCTLCGWSKINPHTNKVPLVVDHISGDCSDSTPGNLRVICNNCDSLLPTYKGANKGRSSRSFHVQRLLR